MKQTIASALMTSIVWHHFIPGVEYLALVLVTQNNETNSQSNHLKIELYFYAKIALLSREWNRSSFKGRDDSYIKTTLIPQKTWQCWTIRFFFFFLRCF